MTVGERIKSARKKAGMTQADLAQKLGIPFQGVSQWERDIRNPKIETLRRIASVLGTEWTDLVPEDLLGSYIAADVIRKTGLIVKNADQIVSDVEQEVETSKTKTDAVVSLIQLNVQSKTVEKLVDVFLSLNDAGQQKAVERVEELTEIPKYQRKPEEGEESAVDPQEND